MLLPPSGSDWEQLLDFLSLASGCSVAVLVFPSAQHADSWRDAIAAHLANEKRTLATLGPYTAGDLVRAVDGLLAPLTHGVSAAVWLPLYSAASAPDDPEWLAALRRTLGAINQSRNLITARNPHPILIAGTSQIIGEASRHAPDLWSIHRLLLRVRAIEERGYGRVASEEPDFAQSNLLYPPAALIPDPEGSLALLERARREKDPMSEIRAYIALAQHHAARGELAATYRVLEQARNVVGEAGENGVSAAFATQVGSLALLFLEAGRFREAEPLMSRALAVDEAVYGKDHPNVATDLSNLAILLLETNRFREAESLMRRALAIDEAAYGKDHPKLGANLNNLAQLLQATNRIGEAEPMMRRALTINEAAYGMDHPEVATALNNLAQLLLETNRVEEAEPMMRRALAIDEAAYGMDHPEVAADLNNLATILRVTNRLGEAEPMMRRALAIAEACYGKDHPKVAIALNNLGQLLKETNRLVEAEAVTRRSLAIDEESYGKDHPKVATRLNNLAQLLKATNRLGEAEPMMRRALAIDEAAYGKDHPEVATDLNNLVLLLLAASRHADTEPLMRRQLIIFLRFLTATGHEHPHTRAALRNYAGLCREMQVPSDELFDRLNSIFSEAGLDQKDATRMIREVISSQSP